MSTAGIHVAVAELLSSDCCTLPKSLFISSWSRGIRLQGSCLIMLFMWVPPYRRLMSRIALSEIGASARKMRATRCVSRGDKAFCFGRADGYGAAHHIVRATFQRTTD